MLNPPFRVVGYHCFNLIIGKLGRPWFFQLGLTMWWTPETL